MHTIVIFFSKDRAMQLDAAIRSCRAHCEDLSSVKKIVIFKTSSKIHTDQYKQLQCENQDFLFIKEVHATQQILELASSFRFISFQCDDNMYIRNFSFSEATQILSENESVFAHSFRLGRNVKYSYTRNSPELQPIFFNLDQKVLRFDWTKMKHRGFGYPLEVSASVYRCKQILPAISEHLNCAVGNIESHLHKLRNRFLISYPYLTCKEWPSVISIPVNRVGVVNNKAGEKHNYSIEYLAKKFSKGFRINTNQYSNYICNVTHVELEFSFEERSCV